jgi:predicted short-subunit dehydrogenase-like oxidoreductase (DUF2520 family)
MDMQTVSIVGVGRLGGALALALQRAGVTIDLLAHRGSISIESPGTPAAKISEIDRIDSDIVLISTADPDIEAVGGMIASIVAPTTIVLHTSGSLSSEVLSSLAEQGNPTGSMHPLVSVSDPSTGAEKFSGAYFCVEGSEQAVVAAEGLVESLGGKYFSIDTQFKPLYHAAAVTSAGHVVALFDTALETLAAAGVEHPHAVLLPLITSAVENLKSQSTSDALTGSFARGDAEAVRRHVAALQKFMPEVVQQIYALLGERSIELAEDAGIDEDQAARMREVISIAKRKSGC